jgi:hypothetical protein
MSDGCRCIGGHTLKVFGEEPMQWQWANVQLRAMDLLELTEKQAKQLFCPCWDKHIAATPKQAAKVMRHFAATGVVDWTVAGCPAPSA